MALCYLFNFFTKEVCDINVALGHLPLEATRKRFGNKETLFEFFDRSKI